MFSCEICEILKNTYFEEDLQKSHFLKCGIDSSRANVLPRLNRMRKRYLNQIQFWSLISGLTKTEYHS